MTTNVAELAVGDKITLLSYSSFGIRTRIIVGGTVVKITKTRVITERVFNEGTPEERRDNERWVVKADGAIHNREGNDRYSEPHFVKSDDPKVARAIKVNAEDDLRNAAKAAAKKFDERNGAWIELEDLDKLMDALNALRPVLVARQKDGE